LAIACGSRSLPPPEFAVAVKSQSPTASRSLACVAGSIVDPALGGHEPSFAAYHRRVRAPREEHRIGLDYLETATTLLQRVRRAHPTAGLFEVADLQWWWRSPRSTDDLPQLFWFDDLDRPLAAVVSTQWSQAPALTPIVMPDAAPDWIEHVIDRGLAHGRACGLGEVDIEVDLADDHLRSILERRGFAFEEDAVVEAWLDAGDRPSISPLHDDYRLSSRFETMDRPHHMINPERNHADVERRLRETSLYRPDLDLVVHHRGGEVGGYGLFWFDPKTATGLVEPMRTEDDHQRRGLARHILTTGIDRLADAGAERVKICFEPDNAAARNLYVSVGFEPVRRTAVFVGPTSSEE
jgi:ribosomal protein S18 acetylase RimI-like enzyme